jgi:hypothetical protein
VAGIQALVEAFQASPPRVYFGLIAALVALGLLALWQGFSRLARARFLEDTPTSLIRSAAQGYVELQGHARLLPGPLIVSPLTGERCVWWDYRIEEEAEDERFGGQRQRIWRTIDAATSDDLFLLADISGDCIVDPVDATVYPSLQRCWRGDSERPGRPPAATPWFSTGRYRYTERLVRYGDFICATGWFRTQSAQHDFDESRDVAELLAEWKRDRRELLRRFDADRSGNIDAQEWEVARQAALEEVRARHVDTAAHPDLDVLGKPPDHRPFILSTLPQDRLIRRQRRLAGLWLILLLVIAGAVGESLKARGGGRGIPAPPLNSAVLRQ